MTSMATTWWEKRINLLNACRLDLRMYLARAEQEGEHFKQEKLKLQLQLTDAALAQAQEQVANRNITDAPK